MAPVAREFRFGIGLPAITAMPTDSSGVPDLTRAYAPSLTDEELLQMPTVAQRNTTPTLPRSCLLDTNVMR